MAVLRLLLAAAALTLPAAVGAGPRFLAVSPQAMAEIELVETSRTAVTALPDLSGCVAAGGDATLFFGCADGRIERRDADTPAQRRIETRVAGTVTGLAVSGDDRFLLVATTAPQLLALDAATLTVAKQVEAEGAPPRVSALTTLPQRRSFLAALRDRPELWEIPYADDAAALPIYRGIMHDYRRESGEQPPLVPGPFPVRTIPLPAPAGSLLDDGRQTVLAAAGDRLMVASLVLGRTLVERAEPGAPVPAAGAMLDKVAAVPLAGGGALLLASDTWSVAARLSLPPHALLLSDVRDADALLAVSEGRVAVLGRDGRLAEQLALPEGRPLAAVTTADGGELLVALAGDRLVRLRLAPLALLTVTAAPAGTLMPLPGR